MYVQIASQMSQNTERYHEQFISYGWPRYFGVFFTDIHGNLFVQEPLPPQKKKKKKKNRACPLQPNNSDHIREVSFDERLSEHHMDSRYLLPRIVSSIHKCPFSIEWPLV